MTALSADPVNGPAIDAKIIPLLDADIDPEAIQAMIEAIQSQPTLTRLVMLISPDEMDRDPVFGFNPKLPPVGSYHHAFINAVCNSGWYPAKSVRLAISGYGSWVLDAPSSLSAPFPYGASQFSDPRFKSAPSAASIELLDEQSGVPKVVPTAQLELIDAAIFGNKPGDPALPEGVVMQTGTSWTPPPSDPIRTEKSSYSGGGGHRTRSPLVLLWFVLMLLSPLWILGALNRPSVE